MSHIQKPTHYCSYCDRKWVSHDPTCIRCGETVNYHYEDLGTSAGILVGAAAAVATGVASGGVVPLVAFVASTTIMGNRIGKDIDDSQRPAKDRRRKKRVKRR